ncbi:VOC family protein [Cognaticolwellia mytili]|uniref:VOC family protein n=1 Tax=Cognaticolwellia mytili TaxID=1888913 RepID=UPI001F419620|nr:VOC family protein [Cognaticolwellia mytili]
MNKYIFTLLLIVLSTPTISKATESHSNTINQKQVMTKGINHLGLTVKNLQASSNFFIKTLGWKEAGGYPDYPSIFVTDGKLFLTLWQTKDINNTVPFDRKNNVGLHHLALSVTSEAILNELHKRFKSVPGLIIEFAPELNGNGPTIHMMIREPSGNRIEFSYNPSRN